MAVFMINDEFAARYPVTAEQYQKACERLAQGEAAEALTAARRALESVVKEFCKKCGIETTDTNRAITLFDMIEQLMDTGFLSENDVSVLHKIRKLCNQGAHVGEGEKPGIVDAEQAVGFLAKALELLQSKDDDDAFSRMADTNNVPMINPDYYDPRRRYSGEWSECYCFEDLAVLADYNALKRKADEGDISAMLDLAIGFMPKKRFWSKEQILCMPKYRARGKEFYQENAYDTRYYYWILRACDKAIENLLNGETYPKKYMANAFLEAMKFACTTLADGAYKYVSGVNFGRNPEEDELIYACQYELVEKLYGKNLLDIYEVVGNSLLWGRELLNLIEEAGSCDIIVGIHQERSVEAIKYLIYCLFCRCYFMLNEKNEMVFDENLTVGEDFALNAEDIGKPVSPELLLQRQPANMSTAYCDMVQRGVSALMNEASNVTRTDNDYTDEQCQAMSFAQLFRAYEAGSPRAALWFGRQKESEEDYFNAYKAYRVYEKNLEQHTAKNYEALHEFNLAMVDFAKRWEEKKRINASSLLIERYEKELYTYNNWELMPDLLDEYKYEKIDPYPDSFFKYLAKMEKGLPEQKVMAADIYKKLSSFYRATACYQELVEDETVNTIIRAKALHGLWGVPGVTPDYNRIPPVVRKVASALEREVEGDYATAEKHYLEALNLAPSLREVIGSKLAAPEYQKAVKESRRKNNRERVKDTFIIIGGLIWGGATIYVIGKMIVSFLKMIFG